MLNFILRYITVWSNKIWRKIPSSFFFRLARKEWEDWVRVHTWVQGGKGQWKTLRFDQTQIGLIVLLIVWNWISHTINFPAWIRNFTYLILITLLWFFFYSFWISMHHLKHIGYAKYMDKRFQYSKILNSTSEVRMRNLRKLV